MKKKIAVLGSTGSIGMSLLNIVKKDKENFRIELLSANKNYKLLLKQANIFNVKKIIITDKQSYNFAKIQIQKNKSKIKIYNNFKDLHKIFKYKIDYVMSSITGIEGLFPTIKIIKYTKNIAIANKESIICAWNLIKNELKKNKTNFIPVDSEHFSIWYALKNNSVNNINKIFITASGGPLLNFSRSKLRNIKISSVLKHPNWKMGKKITVDSSTMMNKVFEIIEAKKIFNINYNKLHILIHPDSYIHAIVEFNDGLKKIIAHDTTMEIPIFNSLYTFKVKKFLSKKIDITKLNKLNLSTVKYNQFPVVKILDKLPNKHSLFETALVSANDRLVELYLLKKIKYIDITKKLNLLLNSSDILKLKKIQPLKIYEILKLNEDVRLKIDSICV